MRRLVMITSMALIVAVVSAEVWARHRVRVLAQVRPGMNIEDVERRLGSAARIREPGAKTGCPSPTQRAYIFVVRDLFGPSAPFIICAERSGIVAATGFVFDSH